MEHGRAKIPPRVLVIMPYIPPVTSNEIMYYAKMGNLNKLVELKTKYPVDYNIAYDKAMKIMKEQKASIDYAVKVLNDIALVGLKNERMVK